MAQQHRAVKGMNDILPEESGKWQRVEGLYRELMGRYGFREVRTPIVEPTGLFVRTIGEATDVVEKEMYSFTRHDEGLTLRPEGTAGAARAFVEHNVHGREPITRWYYMGPMFRAERPQRGRYRQFYQLGAELLGDAGPFCDAEMIDMLATFVRELGIHDLEVLVNSIGGAESRSAYRNALVEFFEPRKEKLSPDSQRRLSLNPLRILDSKNPDDRTICAEAPSILDTLTSIDRTHFDSLTNTLGKLGTTFRVDARLVRGLDYYTGTLFEIKGAKDKLGAGDTLLGGGRYDGMIEELGGPRVPAIGFAAGLERLLIAAELPEEAARVDAMVAPLGTEAIVEGLLLAKELRAQGMRVEVDSRGSSLKAQLRRADALGATWAFLLGENELKEGTVLVKALAARTQEPISRAKLAEWISANWSKKNLP